MAKKKEEKTNVMRILDQRKIPYTARFYEDSQGPEGTREYGVHVAEALGPVSYTHLTLPTTFVV